MATSAQVLAVFRELERRIAEVDQRTGGPQGPRGPIGPKGRKGEKGKDGPQGPKGDAGKDGKQGPQGPKGQDGRPGKDGSVGPMGPSGRDGRDGVDGTDGLDGVGVADASIDFDGYLRLALTDGSEIEAGKVTVDEEALQVVYNAGGGVPDQVKDRLDKVIEDLNNHVNDFDNPHQTSLENLTDTQLDLTNLKEGQGLWYDADTGRWINRAQLAEALPTGLINGGELNIAGGTDVEVVGPADAVIVDSYTDPLAPPLATVLVLESTTQVPITAAPAQAGSIVWVALVDSGVPSTAPDLPELGIPINSATIEQYPIGPTPPQARARCYLGVLVHNGDEWKEISNPKVVNQSAETLRELVTAVLPLTTIISGGEVTEQPSFQLAQAEGVVWENNRNWHVNKADPNREALPASDPITWRYVNRDFTDVGAPTNTMNPDDYDPNGTVSPVPGGGNQATIQRLYLDPANNYWMLWGQNTYQNFNAAEASVEKDNALTEVPPLLEASILLGYVIAEKGKNDWDPNEAIFLPAPGFGAGGGGGGAPITEFINLTDTPVDYTTFRRTVTAVNEDETALEFDYRTKGVQYVPGNLYYPQEMVFEDGYLSIANKQTTDSPVPTPVGPAGFLYTGAAPTAPVTAKQIIFGTRYITPVDEAAEFSRYRVYTVTGNVYQIFSVVDPLGTPRITSLLGFEADTTGWVEFNIPPTLIGAGLAFDLVAIVQEPDPTPIVISADWDYRTPTGTTVFDGTWVIKRANGNPSPGEANSQTNGELWVHQEDKDGTNRFAELDTLVPGDRYTVGGTNYLITAVVFNGGGGGHFRFTVDPTTRPPEIETTITFTRFTPEVPASGEIVQNNNLLDSLRVNKTPSAGGPVDLSGITVGDIIEGAGIRWAVQAITDQTTYWDFTVAPAQQGAPDGVQTFNFETVTATPITRLEDLNFWQSLTEVQGLYVEDDSYDNIVANENAYGIDIFLQRLTQSEDWDIFGVPGGGGGSGGGGGGAEFLTELGDVTLTAPAEGEYLVYSGGQWINSETIDGGTF